MHQRFFDASPELRSLVCGDGVAAVEAVFVGRHVADFAGVPATGRQVRVPYTMFYELDGDAITELRGYLSMSALLSQLQEPAGRPAAGVS
jgi:predicted ester cyclase